MEVTIKNKDITITSEFAFRLLMMAFWMLNTVLNFAKGFFMRLPIVGGFSPYFIPAIFILLIAMSLPYLCRQIKATDVFLYGVVAAVVVFTMIFSYKNAEFIRPELWRILGQSVPVYFLGVCHDQEQAQKDLFWASLLGVCSMYLYYSMQSTVLSEDFGYGMNAAYYTLPSVMYLLYWAFIKKTPLYWAVAALAVAVMFIFGTRGPILAIVVFLAAGSSFSVLKSKNLFIKICFILLCVYVISFISDSDNVVTLARDLSKTFGERGFSTRIFDMLAEGEAASYQDREKLIHVIAKAIKERPLLGYGLMGDRPFIGVYVHNYFYELICQYGIFIGSFVLIITAGFPIYAMIITKEKASKFFLLMLICMMYVKLMLSSSYIFEPYYYLLMGVTMAAFRKRKEAANAAVVGE